VEALEATVAHQQSINAEQHNEIQALTASLKEQASQIQKVSAELAAASRSGGGLEPTNRRRKSSSMIGKAGRGD